MAADSKLMDQRKKMNAKRPAFTRKEHSTFVRIGKSGWRRPRGQHSKVRQKMKGNMVLVNRGYGGPGAVRGALPNGLFPFYVACAADLEKIDMKTQTAVIVGTVGKRKRLALIDAAEKKSITIANIKDVKAYKEKVEKELAERKKKRATVATKKKETLEKEAKDDTPEDIEAEKEAERREAEKVMISQ
jgi:large subunit ribosomal protein L32e